MRKTHELLVRRVKGWLQREKHHPRKQWPGVTWCSCTGRMIAAGAFSHGVAAMLLFDVAVDQQLLRAHQVSVLMREGRILHGLVLG